MFGLSIVLTLFSMGGGGRQNGSPTSFFPVTSTNVGISPQNFLTFNLTIYHTGVKFQDHT